MPKSVANQTNPLESFKMCWILLEGNPSFIVMLWNLLWATDSDEQTSRDIKIIKIRAMDLSKDKVLKTNSKLQDF